MISDAKVMTSKAHREILEHSLDLTWVNGVRGKRPYRNYFCVSVGDNEYEPLVAELIAMGLMARGPLINEGREYYASVTPAGAAEVNSRLPKGD